MTTSPHITPPSFKRGVNENCDIFLFSKDCFHLNLRGFFSSFFFFFFSTALQLHVFLFPPQKKLISACSKGLIRSSVQIFFLPFSAFFFGTEPLSLGGGGIFYRSKKKKKHKTTTTIKKKREGVFVPPPLPISSCSFVQLSLVVCFFFYPIFSHDVNQEMDCWICMVGMSTKGTPGHCTKIHFFMS